MAATVTLIKRLKLSNALMNIAKVAFDNSYPTGGETVTPAQLGLTSIDALIPLPASGYVGEYDITNSTLLAYYADYDAAADGPLVEVIDTGDLSSLEMTVIAIGK